MIPRGAKPLAQVLIMDGPKKTQDTPKKKKKKKDCFYLLDIFVKAK